MLKKLLSLSLITIALAGCDDVSYVQTQSPANAFKDYRNNGSAVLGVGEPVSARQMKANATLRAEGQLALGNLMERMANTYNVAVRYGAGVRKDRSRAVIISDLKFNEARNYVEDTYEVQIVREGERRLLVLPAADAARIENFAPGNNIPLVEAIRALAMQCKINLVINENRRRLSTTRVSASFRDITCTDAFEAVLAPHGMTLVDKGNYYSIGGLPSRTWSLNLFEPLRSESQRIGYDASLGGSTSGIGGNTGASGSFGGGSDGAEASGGGSSELTMRQDRDLMTELQEGLDSLLNEACESRDASGQSVGILSPPGSAFESDGAETIAASCGYVRINRAVGLIQMQAPRDVLNAADALIKRTEDIASRRLLVEARIIAVNRDRSFKQGAESAARINTGRNSDIALGFGGGLVSEGFQLAPSESISGLLSSLSGAGGAFGIRDSSIQGMLNFLETFTTTYQLMQPTLEVMDRQKAVMIDGRNDVFFIRESQVLTGDGGNVNNVTATERRQFEGIQFAVTAQISDGDEPHTLHLQIPITEIIGTEPLEQVFNGQALTDQIPIVNTRIIDQKVRSYDGEVKVVGGLTRTMAVDSESGIPLLRGVPLAGKIVNNETINFEEVEFLVLLQVKRIR